MVDTEACRVYKQLRPGGNAKKGSKTMSNFAIILEASATLARLPEGRANSRARFNARMAIRAAQGPLAHNGQALESLMASRAAEAEAKASA